MKEMKEWLDNDFNLVMLTVLMEMKTSLRILHGTENNK